jgi:fermentation-respiration switch protein FrsA (DUF1100 family)
MMKPQLTSSGPTLVRREVLVSVGRIAAALLGAGLFNFIWVVIFILAAGKPPGGPVAVALWCVAPIITALGFSYGAIAFNRLRKRDQAPLSSVLPGRSSAAPWDQVAVASCGCHDNRMDKASWNEQWMGYPVGPQYAECSNIENAARLRGKLFLVVGEMDTNVPPESTYRFVDALIRANKDFDFLMVPNANHGPGGAYGIRRMQDYFVRHLLGVEPPDRNAEPAP